MELLICKEHRGYALFLLERAEPFPANLGLCRFFTPRRECLAICDFMSHAAPTRSRNPLRMNDKRVEGQLLPSLHVRLGSLLMTTDVADRNETIAYSVPSCS